MLPHKIKPINQRSPFIEQPKGWSFVGNKFEGSGWEESFTALLEVFQVHNLLMKQIVFASESPTLHFKMILQVTSSHHQPGQALPSLPSAIIPCSWNSAYLQPQKLPAAKQTPEEALGDF